MNYKQFLGFTLIWVSKLLLFTECQTCNLTIEDPKWNDMWYLNNPRTNGYDMNVLPAWTSCVNGTGVTVGVVDNGVQDHIDLNINRTLNAGYTYTRELEYQLRSRQSPRNWFRSPAIRKRQYQESLKHGTRVAGIVAAKKNEQGIIGIAFGATLADVRIASTSVFETFNASLLTHQSDVIDVYSCSFANFHTGTKTYALLPNQENALREGTTNGRGGLGSVYVFATGNSGGKKKNLFRDSCAYDRLVTNRYVISVAGIQHNLKKLPNGEACSAMMVAAFTTKPGEKRKHRARVITTDIGNKTTFNFNQNSAAAPMVSGAVALALSANPSLTYRDIMHLLVNTARSDLLQNKTKFFENAAGFNVSSYFGFGLLDIGTLVERSKTWELVPDRHSCHSTEIVDSPLNRRSKYFAVKVNGCNVTYVEHIEVSLIVNHQHAGQIQWILVSPYGTKSTILPGRVLDQTTTMKLTVLTVQMWGENPEGYWRLKPKPMFGKTLDKGTVKSVGLLIHGYSCGNNCTVHPAKQAPGDWKKWSRWSECTVSCGNGTQTRSRQCNDRNNFKYCSGENFETVQCDQSECQVDGQSEVRSDECPSPSHLTDSCVEQCTNDSDCSVQEKCCYNGCGHTCEMSRAKVISDECPSPSFLINKCVEQCSFDSECSVKQKCCYNGCGHSCETSTTYLTSQTVITTPEQDQTTLTVKTTSEQDQTTQTVRTTPEQDQTTQTVRTSPEQDQTTQIVRTTPEQDQTTQTIRASCTDTFPDCSRYVKNAGGCKPYVKNYCQKTCRLCN
ncbi:neuroendocrine convertase 2-like isoform X3 [Mytilus californianus]|uniref:neuroendocrine convertase 2-like isoform X3 n=1 Tax=Mytilus californianus TaxID=6549 RepID=UPI002245A5CF|nr:neuroendocrine convertase 2-like isoform X3 [Mytilus californianus]